MRFPCIRPHIAHGRFLAAALWTALLLCPLFVRAQVVLVLQPGSSIATVAGTGADGAVTPGSAVASALGTPRAVAYDAAGNLIVADARNHQVLRVDTAGKLTVLAGTGRQGFAGDGGPATRAELNTPSGVAVDSAGNIFIADTGNGRVRRIAVADGTINTVAGSGVAGFSGDNGPAVAAALRAPGALAIDGTGAVYIADTGNHRVRKLLTNGTLTTVAGNGQEGDAGDGGAALAASFGTVAGLAVLSNGQVLIADTEARRVRALNSDGTITAYSLGTLPVRRPTGLSGSNNSVYVADSALQTVGAAGTDGASTLAGGAGQGVFHSGNPLQTSLDTPVGVAAGAGGLVAIADAHNHQVQQVAAPALDFGSVPAGSTSAAQTLTLTDGGTAPLTGTALQVPAGFANIATGTTCAAAPFTLQPGSSCSVALVFAPAVQGAGNAMAQVRFTGGAPATVLLKGFGAANGSLSGSVTALLADGSISYAGSAVTLTATVAGQLLAAPIGNVTFMDGTVALATVPLTGNSAVYRTASLSTGAHALHAVYAGDAAYSTSASPAIALTVVPTPDFTLAATAASYSGTAGGSVMVPLTVLPVNGTLDQVMQISVTGLPTGSKASFVPSTFTLGGTSTPVSLTIQLPSTLSAIHHNDWPAPLYALLLLPCVLPLRGGRAASLYLLVIGSGAALGLAGCGSGFRPGVTAADLSGTRTYTAVVTATTTGVLGTPLAHSTSVGLVVSR